jgi:signal transduction histidine kinase
MNSLLEEIYLLVKNDCKEKNIKAEFTKEDEPLFVKGDRNKLKQVFLNLVKNAIEAMNDGGRLQIRSKKKNGLIEAIIVDEGCGIPECDREQIFSPFFTTKHHGTGLGLGITKSIVDAHEGSSFTLKSQEGKGTTFEVTMPVFREK